MSLAFLYAGQGSQHPGMGADLYEAHPAFRAVLDAAGVDFDLKTTMFTDPDGVLNLTEYTQPCMVAFAAGCLVGRLGMALCFALVEQFASNIMVLLSILAANAAMIILVRRGVTPIRSAELFEGEQATGDLDAARRAKVDRVAAACGLGEREKEVLTLLLEGCSASEVASAMVVANGTAKSHIRHVYKKLGVHSRDELFEKLGIEREEKKG